MNTQRAKDMNPPSPAERMSPTANPEDHSHRDEDRKVFPYSVREGLREKENVKAVGRSL